MTTITRHGATITATLALAFAGSGAHAAATPEPARAMAKNASVDANATRGRTVPKGLRGKCRFKTNRHGFVVCRKATRAPRALKPYRKG